MVVEPVTESELTVDSEIYCFASVDLFRIRQVLQNLFSNAIKYTVEGRVKAYMFFDRSQPIVSQQPAIFLIGFFKQTSKKS